MIEVKGSRRQLQAAETRQALLSAAEELFVRDGFAATSIDGIGRLAHASKGTVYHHFADKRQVFAEVFRAQQARVVEAGISVPAREDDPWGWIAEVIRAILREYVADPRARAMLVESSGVLGPEGVREIDEATALPAIRSVLGSFIARGEIVEVDVDVASQLAYGLFCQGVMVVASADDPARESVAAQVETLILDMLNGLRRRD